MSAETDEQKQERLTKWRRDRSRRSAQTAKWEMRTCQCKCLTAETTANKDTRLQQISNRQCEKLGAETTHERDARFYSE